jgi:hypothetical protein
VLKNFTSGGSCNLGNQHKHRGIVCLVSQLSPACCVGQNVSSERTVFVVEHYFASK